MRRMSPNRFPQVLLAFALLALSACTHVSLNQPAPVEQRAVGKPAQAASSPASAASTAAPAAVDAKPQPGFYLVKAGDSLLRIALDNGQNWRDVAKWNGITNPDRIDVGQTLRVLPPGAEANTNGVTTKPITTAKTDAPRPLDSKPEASKPAASAPAIVTPAGGSKADDDLNWGWPVNGPVIANFDEPRSKGLDFGGKVGDPVYAAADGRVVYVGNDLRGFGNLVIIKHNDTYLTAYAHNQTLLVKDEQVVRKGQRIAEMGSTDADQVKLHFEVRKQGKPIDPARVLPNR